MSRADRPMRILQYTYGGAFVSGIDTYLTETYRCLDKDILQFDFLYRYQNPLPPETRAELVAGGARLYSLGVDESRHPVRRQVCEAVRLVRFFSAHRYHAVEINMTAPFMIIQCAVVARLFGARIRVVHAHDSVKNERRTKRILKGLFKPLVRVLATHLWACSADAAAYLYGLRTVERGGWELVQNGVNADRFAYSEVARRRIRSELRIEDETCVGVVGRFTEQKNQSFVLPIARAARELALPLRFVMVGDGPLLEQVRSEAATAAQGRDLQFLGARKDVPELMSAFDVVVAPSRHEGFPLIGLEAQASGLPLVVSDAWPPEMDLRGNVQFLSLRDDPARWALAIANSRAQVRSAGVADVTAAGFDRTSTARRVENLYRAAIREGG